MNANDSQRVAFELIESAADDEFLKKSLKMNEIECKMHSMNNFAKIIPNCQKRKL